MSGTKRLALRRPKSQKANVSGWLPLSVVVSFALAAPVQAQPLPLPAEEQDAVNDAILRGVDYLKRTQQPSGTWAKPGAAHQLGYAVLPALTLLECGVPPSDPIIRQAARYVRAKALKIDTTYELSLAILFLDRLGDRKDKKIIQAFALRLIAGQSMTGGWGYKCPNLPGPLQIDLLVALRHLDPWPNGMPGIGGNPGGGMPGLAGGAGKNPGDLDPLARAPSAPPPGGTIGQSATPSLFGSTTRGSFGEALSPQELVRVPPSRWRDCLGLGILDGGDLQPLDGDPKAWAGQKDPPAKPEGHAKAERPTLKKRFVIPERFRRLTVFHDLPPLHIQVEDPPDKRHDLFLMTTDNSNTQLAILALWTAQRYEVPMHRTLNLIVRRFLTSQNLDGSWDYDYHFGGNVQGKSGSSPAMTCVGLIGLAVGHGLAQPAAAGRLVQDPRVLKGLSALYRTIGKPSNPPMKLPMQNLYFLWSVERVAVLYNLPRIGDKDWFRWGAQVLVANQEAQGSWVGGGYPGNSPTVDTCLALLFLKRANLAKDLAAKLPFKAADLNHGIMAKQKPPPPLAKTKPPELSESIKKTILPAKPSTQEAADNLITKPLSSPEGTASAGAAEAESGTSGSNTKGIVLSLLAFIFFAGGSVFVLFVARRRNEEEEEKPEKPKKRKNKRQKSPSTT